MDLTEAEYIKKWWQECEELYQKIKKEILITQITMMVSLLT